MAEQTIDTAATQAVVQQILADFAAVGGVQVTLLGLNDGAVRRDGRKRSRGRRGAQRADGRRRTAWPASGSRLPPPAATITYDPVTMRFTLPEVTAAVLGDRAVRELFLGLGTATARRLGATSRWSSRRTAAAVAWRGRTGRRTPGRGSTGLTAAMVAPLGDHRVDPRARRHRGAPAGRRQGRRRRVRLRVADDRHRAGVPGVPGLGLRPPRRVGGGRPQAGGGGGCDRPGGVRGGAGQPRSPARATTSSRASTRSTTWATRWAPSRRHAGHWPTTVPCCSWSSRRATAPRRTSTRWGA